MIERARTKKLARYAKTFPAIAIIGPRQCGKTTLAKAFVKSMEREYVYVDVEKASDRDKLENPELFFADHRDKTVVIDEVQLMPALFSALRSAIDEDRRPMRFLLLGSANPDIMKDTSETLAGRLAYLELQPFNIEELKAHEISVGEHHFFGGFPNAILEKDSEARLDWLDNFIATYIQRDLPMYGLPTSPVQTRRLLEMLAWLNGKLLDYSNIGKSLGVSHVTLKSYLEYLHASFVTMELEPFHFNIKKRLTKSSKVYFRDTGVLHRFLKLANYNELLSTPFLGNSWETYVINQIYSLKNDEVELFFYRTYSGAELDLVLAKGMKPMATVEIKFSEKPDLTRGNTTSIKDLGSTDNYVIVPGEQDYRKSETIRVCGLRQFLEGYLPKFQ
ncbi:MAG: ATP-binding protein [Bacteroidia bacterium]